MGYQIIDNGATIRFVGDFAEMLVLKRAIQEVSVVREDMLAIKMSSPAGAIYFRKRDVTDPSTGSALDLRDAINAMIPA